MTAITELPYPFKGDGPVQLPALSSDDQPVNASELQRGQRSDKRLRRDKPDGGRDCLEMSSAEGISVIFDAHTYPDIRRPIEAISQLGQIAAIFS